MAAFKARTDLGLEIVVAFGQQGREGEVASRSNMPAFHEKLSRSATERVVQYVRTLPVKISEYPKLEADKPIVETE
jgi:mono/diheme cytochrome c family protein